MPGPWWTPGLFLPFVAVECWAWSTVIETLVWMVIFNRQMGLFKPLHLLAWVGLMQAVSTPLSIGVSLLLLAALLPLLQAYPPYLSLLLQEGGVILNPVSLIVAFLLLPIAVEFWVWRDSKRWNLLHMGARKISLLLPDSALLTGTIASNSVSLLIGACMVAWMLILVFAVTIFPLISLLILTSWGFLFSGYQAEPKDGDMIGGDVRRDRGGGRPGLTEKSAHRGTLAEFRGERSKRGLALALTVLILGFSGVTVAYTYSSTLAPWPSWPRYPYSGVKAVLDGEGRIHVVWGDEAYHANGQTGVVIKYRCLDDGVWSEEEEVATPRDVTLVPWMWGNPPLQISLALDGEGRLAVGWVEVNSSPPYRWIGCYRIRDGGEWKETQTLPCTDCTSLSLQFVDGALHALWVDMTRSEEDTVTWVILHWPVGSNSPPMMVAEINATNMGAHYGPVQESTLIHDDMGNLYALWRNYENYTFSPIYSSFYDGNSWSETMLVTKPETIASSWAAVAGSNATIHIVWEAHESNYHANGYYGNVTLCNRRAQYGVWGDIEVLERSENGAYHVEGLSSDREGNLQVIWWCYWEAAWSTKKYINGVWQPTGLMPLPHTYGSKALVMVSPDESHLIMDEKIGTATRLIHYRLEGDDNPYLASSQLLDSINPEFFHQLQVASLFQGLTLTLTGLLLPASTHILRRCFQSLTF